MTNLMLRTPFSTLPTFNRLLSNPFSVFDDTSLSASSNPAVIIYETGEEYVLQAELPGWTRDQVTLDFENQTLTLQGKRDLPTGEGRKYHRVEGFFGEFTRSFTLPNVVNPEAIAADLRDGVLTVRLPKRETVKARRVEIETVAN